MIDRFTIYQPADQLSRKLGVKMDSAYQPTYNAIPAKTYPVVTNLQNDTLQLFHWGITQSLAKKKSVSARLINVTVNQIHSKTINQKAIQTHRCIVPANGLYWMKPIGKKQQLPTYLFMGDHELFFMAGVWEKFEDLDGNALFTFKLIIRDDLDVKEYGVSDFPMIIEEEKVTHWLGNVNTYEEAMDLMILPHVNDVASYSVAPTVLKNEVDDSTLILARKPADQFGNYTLFD